MGETAAPLNKYTIYRNWGGTFWQSVSTDEAVWEAIGNLDFGEGYEVRDDKGNIIPRFVPF